jgi:cell fate regulator YaaT (PSP1 superfamily)
VETEQGLFFALVASGPLETAPGPCGRNGGAGRDGFHLQEASSPPRILRAASQQDWDKEHQNRELAREAVLFCRRCIAERCLDMKLVDVEVFFDRSKLIFYFTAPARIDFRELVKELVQKYRTRIELRQIGVRHETQMVGAVGNCGMVCCCRRYLRKFASVTIRMAKEQNLFLNPAKISGICGRLLCCLAYEQDNYDSFHKACPRLGKKYRTCRGNMKVLRSNMFRNSLVALTENNEELELTLEEWQALSPQRTETPTPAAQADHPVASLPARTDDTLLVVSATPDTLDSLDISEDPPDKENIAEYALLKPGDETAAPFSPPLRDNGETPGKPPRKRGHKCPAADSCFARACCPPSE